MFFLYCIALYIFEIFAIIFELHVYNVDFSNSGLSVAVEYNHSSRLEVNRKSRSLLRLLKSSKSFKLEIWYKRLELMHQQLNLSDLRQCYLAFVVICGCGSL